MESCDCIKKEEMDIDETESDWYGYACKSEEILFYYNIKTGEHRWATAGSSRSENTIRQVRTSDVPPKPKELCSVATQTEDYGCVNQCTSMYVDNERQMENRDGNSNEIKEKVTDDDKIDVNELNVLDSNLDKNLDEDGEDIEKKEVIIDEMINDNEQNSSNNANFNDNFDEVIEDIEMHNLASKRIKKRKNEVQVAPPQQLKSKSSIHKCPHCRKAFETKFQLDVHLQTHPGEKPYGCSCCGKTFTRTDSLKRHLRIHSGKKPHQCSYCGRSFLWKNVLVRHIRTHTGEKPYKCSYCDRAFTGKKSLENHLQRHTDAKASESSHCDKAFTARMKQKTLNTKSCSEFSSTNTYW